MRTTLDIDDRVLTVAKARAAAHKTTMGHEVSVMALQTLDAPTAQTSSGRSPSGRFRLLPASGHTITSQMVEDALHELD